MVQKLTEKSEAMKLRLITSMSLSMWMFVECSCCRWHCYCLIVVPVGVCVKVVVMMEGGWGEGVTLCGSGRVVALWWGRGGGRVVV